MLGTIILLVLGLGLTGAGVPVTALIVTGITAAVNEDAAPLGFIGGWVLGILVAGSGLVLAIFQAISLVQQLTS